MRLWTIGHSTRSLDAFIALLRREQIVHLADVRSYPVSRRHAHFNREPLAQALSEHGVAYSHRPALGGRRTPLPHSPHGAWRNAGFRGYADHMDTPEFQRAITELESVSLVSPTAIMCAEAVPWRCHRSLIADALTVRGSEVLHIMDASTNPHVLTRFAVVRDGRVAYPASSTPPRAQGDLFAR